MTEDQRNDDILPTMLPVLRDRWFEPLRSPVRRKALTMLGAGLILAAIVLAWRESDWLTWAGMPALLVVSLLGLVTRAMADAPADKLDERMVAARNQAFRAAYYLLGLAVIAVVVLILVATGDAGVSVARSQWLGAAWSMALLVMFLPSAVLAWTEDII